MKTLAGLVLLIWLLAGRGVAAGCLIDGEAPSSAEIQMAMAATGALTQPAVQVMADKCWPRRGGLAFYDLATQTINLRQGWRTGPAGIAALFHEMRHHWQLETGATSSIDADECDAHRFTARFAATMPGADWRRWGKVARGAARDYCR